MFTHVSPGAPGWLGSTGGATDGGELALVVRFESAGAARRDSDRPEQGEGAERLRSRRA